MFEKEAEKFMERVFPYDDETPVYGEEQVKGLLAIFAESIYNKANEWYSTNRNEKHQVIDCPKGEEDKLYLLLLNSSDSKEFEFGRKVPVVCYWNEEWCRFERLEHTIGERVVNPNDINAWKEIILPKEDK